MTQTELDYQVASRTGESLATIRRMGFVALTPLPYECESRPNVVDWDEVDAQRTALFPQNGRTR